MSKTPRTDVEVRFRSGQEVVLVGFARQLETELVWARAEIEACKKGFLKIKKIREESVYTNQAKADPILVICSEMTAEAERNNNEKICKII